MSLQDLVECRSHFGILYLLQNLNNDMEILQYVTRDVSCNDILVVSLSFRVSGVYVILI
jgi:hypothetical protein